MRTLLEACLVLSFEEVIERFELQQTDESRLAVRGMVGGANRSRQRGQCRRQLQSSARLLGPYERT